MDRRDFVRTTAAGVAVAATPSALSADDLRTASRAAAPAVHLRRARPLCVSDVSSIRYRNGGPESAIERAFRGITEGEDVLDAIVAGVTIPELDPEERGIGYGGLPNADGVVQLDSCLMHGPRRWAGGVAGIEGVRTPSLVAKAVAELTDHHLIVGRGATELARALGFEIEEDLNTEESRRLWLEWKRRIDPGHWLDPEERLRGTGRTGEDTDPDGRPGRDRGGASRRAPVGAFEPAASTDLRWRRDPEHEARLRRFYDACLEAGLSMVDDGLIAPHSFWGTTSLEAVSADGDICGVTTTSGLSWKIPGRAGDSPILGAGQYVDNEVGAAGSTGRGEANLFNCASFLIVENMRRGMSPKDAGMAALERIRDNTVEARLQNERGLPSFDVRFFILSKAGDYAGVALYGTGESTFAVCDENGAREEQLEGLLEGTPRGAAPAPAPAGRSAAGAAGVLALAALLGVVASPAHAQDMPQSGAADTLRFEPTVGHPTFAVREPVARIRPNTVLISSTMHGAYYEPGGGAFPGEVGPFYVEGAEVGDVLSVEIIRVQPNHDLAGVQLYSDFGGLATDSRLRLLNDPIPARRYEWSLDHEAMTGTVALPDSEMREITIELRPMLGRVAVAPANGEAFVGLWPGDFGGNMDAPEVREGTTVYLPVFNDGAYFYFGDGHARQGEGEVNGTGLETSMDVTLKIDLIEGRTIAWPRLEDADHIMVAGSARPLIDAFRLAHVELIEWLVADYGFGKWDAYMLVGQLGESTVANIVDPIYTVIAKFPKRYLPER